VRDITSADLPPALAVPFGLMEDAFRRLTNRVKNMNQAELEYTGPPGNRNSTAMLLRHLAYTDLGYFYMIRGEPIPADLEAEYGPVRLDDNTLPVVTGLTAEHLLEQYRRIIDMVGAYLRTLPEADAERSVQVPWWQGPATVRYLLWHMAGHSMFHQGQISRLQLWHKQQG
jgi:uncharacterized damage-inducible protein DinB